MNSNPCVECIVRSMCDEYCCLLTKYINSHLKEYKILYADAVCNIKRDLIKSVGLPTLNFNWSYEAVRDGGQYLDVFSITIKNGQITAACIEEEK